MSETLLHTPEEAQKDLMFMYSPFLRDRIMDINPHRIPCMYSSTMEENAVTTLASISECPDYPDIPPPGSGISLVKHQGVKEAWSPWTTPYTKTTSQNWPEPEVELGPKTRSATEVKQTTSLSDLVSDDVLRPPDKASQTRRSTSRPTRLSGSKRDELTWADCSLKEDSAPDSCGHRLSGRRPLKRQQMLSPWRTCWCLHPLEQLSFSSGSPVSRQRLSASSRHRRTRSTSSAQRRTAATARTADSYDNANVNTIQKFLKWRPAGEAGSHKTHTKPTASSVKTKSGSAPGSALTKPPSGEKQGKQAVGSAPARRVADIPFKFLHHRSHCSYMRHYKAGFTYRKLYPSLSCSPTDLHSSQLSRVDAHCADLRDGATLKVSEFHFKMKQTRTIVHSHTREENPGKKANSLSSQDVEKARSPSPRPANSFPRPSCGVVCMSLPGGNTLTPVTSSSRNPVSPPVVCRSRPSIPSNHRGVVCPTAVETPGHVVRRLGRGHRRTSATSTVDHMALLVEGRIPSKLVDSKPDKKLG